MAVEVVTWAVSPAHWPKVARLRIVILSDLHACEPWMDEARIAAIVDQAQGLQGDLIALLGDYPGHLRFSRVIAPPRVAALLARLTAPLGVWTVFGNHDWGDDPGARDAGTTHWHRAFEAEGIMPLENAHRVLDVGGASVALVGLGSWRAFRVGWRRREGVDDLPAALDGLEEAMPKVLLAHEPDVFPDLPGHVSLTLSGHTHGGQVRLFGRPWVVPSKYGTRYAYGVYEQDGRHLVVSGGLGCSGLPIRWRMPPEITVVEVG